MYLQVLLFKKYAGLSGPNPVPVRQMKKTKINFFKTPFK